jgi:oligopeptide/dipeptide ABC transporter ATP-binding protein
MYAGRIVEQGPVRDVFASPEHPYTQALLRSTISLTTQELHSIPGAPPDLVAPPSGCRFHPRCPSAMQICPTKFPPRFGTQQAECWLHDPSLTDAQKAPLDRQEVSVADEA